MNSNANLKSSVSVFLVALPLCLGLAIASGAQPVSGLIAGIIGGIVVGYLSNSPISVAGPAAGLTVVVVDTIATMGGFPQFLSSLIFAGLFQIAFGLMRGGMVGNFFPTSVIQGLLTAIGLLLVFKQLPHAVGYDVNYEGDDSFHTLTGENTFAEIFHGFQHVHLHALTVFACGIVFYVIYERLNKKKSRFATMIPTALATVVVGLSVNSFLGFLMPDSRLTGSHLVQLPGFREFFSAMTFPDLPALWSVKAVTCGLTMAMIASLETLLNIDASDKLDPLKRITSRNRELVAQGVGNIFNGFLGGLPVTSVVVRTTVNVSAGGNAKSSTIYHGVWLMLSVFLASVLNLIPLSALAVILIMVGYKLCHPGVFASMFKKGWNQFIPFIATVVAILFSNLLTGTVIGILVGLVFVIRTNVFYAIVMVNEGNNYLIRMQKDVSFLNKSKLREILLTVPDNAYLIVDGSRTVHIDFDIMETLRDFFEQAPSRGITVELKKSTSAISPMFMEELT